MRKTYRKSFRFLHQSSLPCGNKCWWLVCQFPQFVNCAPFIQTRALPKSKFCVQKAILVGTRMKNLRKLSTCMIKYCYLLGNNDSLSSEIELANLGLDLQGIRKPTPRFSLVLSTVIERLGKSVLSQRHTYSHQ